MILRWPTWRVWIICLGKSVKTNMFGCWNVANPFQRKLIRADLSKDAWVQSFVLRPLSLLCRTSSYSKSQKKVWKESIKVFLVLCGLYDTIKVEEFVSIRQNFAFIFSGAVSHIISYRAQKTLYRCFICRQSTLHADYWI